ncbi:MAG TPA: FHIPEP family type III secretion protein, partial [Candidatus Acidoferrales bacterium]|nr:FHIPEP family type III secretion protein [Candidatus Acidoferrales bacterium]
MIAASAQGSNILAIGVLASIAMLIIPLPPPLLDVLLAFDIMFATAVLVVSLSIQNPLELAAFPSLLLVTTLFRLSLDVSATRLIL